MQVDQGKAIIRLVEGNVVRGISDLCVEDDLSVVLGVDGGGFCDTTDGLAMFFDVLLDEFFLTRRPLSRLGRPTGV